MNADTTMDTVTAPLLLDQALPDFRFTRLECVMITAPPSAVYEATRELDLLTIHAPLFDAVMWVRGMPYRLRSRPMPTPPTMRVADLFDVAGKRDQDQPWVALGESPRRELVFGAVGKVWKPAIEWHRIEPEAFAAFDEPGWAKMAAAFTIHPYGTQRSLLVYEARTVCTDPASTARFGRYWTLVSPGVGIVLRTALRSVRTAVEHRDKPGPVRVESAERDET